MKRKIIYLILVLSVGVNVYLFQQLNSHKQNTRLAQFGKIQNGVNYAYNFGAVLKDKYKDLSLKEKTEYLGAMSWSLQLSAHTLEIVEPNEENYWHLAQLFNLYSHIPSSNDLGVMIEDEETTDEEVVTLIGLWLTDLVYLNDNLDYSKISKMNDSEFQAYWASMLKNLKYDNKELNKYKQTFLAADAMITIYRNKEIKG